MNPITVIGIVILMLFVVFSVAYCIVVVTLFTILFVAYCRDLKENN